MPFSGTASRRHTRCFRIIVHELEHQRDALREGGVDHVAFHHEGVVQGFQPAARWRGGEGETVPGWRSGKSPRSVFFAQYLPLGAVRTLRADKPMKLPVVFGVRSLSVSVSHHKESQWTA